MSTAFKIVAILVFGAIFFIVPAILSVLFDASFDAKTVLALDLLYMIGMTVGAFALGGNK